MANVDRSKPVEWDAQAYHRLSDPQLAWGRRVIERLGLRGDETVMDAGCGSGRLTAELLELLPKGRVIAVDGSQNMIDAARAKLAPRFGDRVEYVSQDLQDLRLATGSSDRRVDVIFSTATFHWILDHDQLFQRLFQVLRPGGRLVAQCGGAGNLARLFGRARVLMATEPFASFFAGAPDPWVFHDEISTAARLRAAGFVDVETSIEVADTPFADAETYRDFLQRVVFAVHFARASGSSLPERFAAALTEEAREDDPPFVLDYRRLNMAGRRPP